MEKMNLGEYLDQYLDSLEKMALNILCLPPDDRETKERRLSIINDVFQRMSKEQLKDLIEYFKESKEAYIKTILSHAILVFQQKEWGTNEPH